MVDPELLFQKAQIQPGMHIADLGCGRTGHIVFPASKIVGEDGLVYAVDIVKEILQVVNKRAKASNILNVHTVWADIEQVGYTAIPAHSLDVAFLINTLVHAEDVGAMLQETKRLLKEKARVVVVDWYKRGLTFGPDDENYINFEEVKSWARENGLTLQEEFDVGNFHYGLVFFQHE